MDSNVTTIVVGIIFIFVFVLIFIISAISGYNIRNGDSDIGFNSSDSDSGGRDGGGD